MGSTHAEAGKGQAEAMVVHKTDARRDTKDLLLTVTGHQRYAPFSKRPLSHKPLGTGHGIIEAGRIHDIIIVTHWIHIKGTMWSLCPWPPLETEPPLPPPLDTAKSKAPS